MPNNKRLTWFDDCAFSCHAMIGGFRRLRAILQPVAFILQALKY